MEWGGVVQSFPLVLASFPPREQVLSRSGMPTRQTEWESGMVTHPPCSWSPVLNGLESGEAEWPVTSFQTHGMAPDGLGAEIGAEGSMGRESLVCISKLASVSAAVRLSPVPRMCPRYSPRPFALDVGSSSFPPNPSGSISVSLDSWEEVRRGPLAGTSCSGRIGDLGLPVG